MEKPMFSVGPLLGGQEVGYSIGEYPSGTVDRYNLVQKLRQIADHIPGSVIGVTHVAIGEVPNDEEPQVGIVQRRTYLNRYYIVAPKGSELNGEGKALQTVLEQACQEAKTS